MRPASLPRLALIADRFTCEDRADRAVRAVEAGVRWVHLRDHQASPDAFADRARTLTSRLRAASEEVLLSVNTHVPAAEEAADGVHLGWRGPSVQEARDRLGADAVIGFSAHDDLDADGDRARGVDYFFFSPVYPTPSKPDHPGTGVGALRRFCRTAAPVPVLALGGITPSRVRSCRAAGAHGVAVLSGIMEVDTPVAAARAYLRALSTVDFGREAQR
jgi:thiamine-phosphate pyrophosphorylase